MNESYVTPGTVLLGKYRIEKLLGMGAMGVVVLATHLDLKQRVAMKFMLPGKTPNPERHQRFLREAQIASRLTTSHVARVIDVGTMPDGGAPYMVMEYLQGSDLAAVLTERGQLPILEAAGYLLQVCEAVGEAHAAGIVHRDLKPANLFLTKTADGQACVKVLDFGVSKLTDAGLQLTQDAVTLGSPLYMPPEQMSASKDVDGRADIWALGVILYELIAGVTPFHADQLPQLCTRVFTGDPTPLGQFRSDAPVGLEAVLLRCFEKKREQRWRNVAELAAALVPFAPARAVVHAERVAAILGLNEGPSRMTDVLPPEPVAEVPPQRAQAMSAGNGGTLDNGSVTKSPGSAVAPRSRGGAVLGVGLGVVALGVVGMGVMRWRGGPGAAAEAQPSGIVTGVPFAVSAMPATSPPLPGSAIAVPQVAPSAAIVPPPATSAAASGTVTAVTTPAPRLPTRQTTPSIHPTATAKASTPLPKRSILEKD
jgi:eukaryotic-like serine/threonine-protein kinase